MRRLMKGAALALPLLLATVALPSVAGAQEPPSLPPPPPPPPPAPPGDAPAAAPPPAAQAPAPYYTPQTAPIPPPYPGAAAPRLRMPQGHEESIRFEPDDPDTALMMRSGEVPVRHVTRFRHIWYYERGFAPLYAPVCEGPCTTQLAPGEYHLALSRSGGRAVPAGTVVLQGPSAIHGYYTDKSALRVAGAVIGIGGIVTGIVMVVASVSNDTVCDDTGDNCYQHETTNGALLGGGIAVIVGSAIVGSILAAQRDSAQVTVSPLNLGSIGPMKEQASVGALAALAATPPPQGAALTVHF